MRSNPEPPTMLQLSKPKMKISKSARNPNLSGESKKWLQNLQTTCLLLNKLTASLMSPEFTAYLAKWLSKVTSAKRRRTDLRRNSRKSKRRKRPKSR